MYMYILNICDNTSFMTLLLIIKYVINIIFILTPIILIYRGVSVMAKSVLAGGNFSDYLIQIGKSFIAALVVFLIPSFVNYFFSNYLTGEVGRGYTCYVDITVDKLLSMKSEEQSKREEELRKKEEIEILNFQQALDEAKKRQEQLDKERELYQQQQNSGWSSSVSGSNSPNVGYDKKNSNKTIIVGDSRTVGMCATLTGDWTNCQFSNGGVYTYGDVYFIAQGSMGYNWFSSAAVSAVDNIINSHVNTTYNIVSLMGVNGLLFDLNRYISLYPSLISNNWKNHNVILVSVTPVDEVLELQHGYSTKNTDIEKFNIGIKDVASKFSNSNYCDVYNSIKGNIGTSDGLHYDSNTYMRIYGIINNCL